MKILFAIKNMNNAKGGAERVLSIVMNGLAEKGYDISLMTFDGRGLDSFYDIDSRIKRLSLAIGKSNQRAGILETFARIKAMRRVVQVRKPDIVIPFMHSMFIPLSFALIGIKIPIIASEHIVPMHYKKKKHEYLLLMVSSFFVKKITVLSESVRKLYPSFIQKKMVVMPNPVYIYPEKMELREQGKNKNIILNIGRLSDQKDQKTLIRAFALLADKYTNWDVRIAGEGELRDFLQKEIDKSKLQDRIHLIGTTNHISREYKKADIFAMSSKYESFGLATAEAMSFGIPAIGFQECAGTNEIIFDKKNGLLVSRKKNRIQNFASGLEKLMKSEKLRNKLGKQAQKDITQFQPTLIVDRWENLIVKTAKS
jgi:glycosyltransferase involved in cell wall biosynthesis